jgi:hypothetical protein
MTECQDPQDEIQEMEKNRPHQQLALELFRPNYVGKEGLSVRPDDREVDYRQNYVQYFEYDGLPLGLSNCLFLSKFRQLLCQKQEC